MYYSAVKETEHMTLVSQLYGLGTVFADIGCEQHTHTEVVFNHISAYLVFRTSLHLASLQKNKYLILKPFVFGGVFL